MNPIDADEAEYIQQVRYQEWADIFNRQLMLQTRDRLRRKRKYNVAFPSLRYTTPHHVHNFSFPPITHLIRYGWTWPRRALVLWGRGVPPHMRYGIMRLRLRLWVLRIRRSIRRNAQLVDYYLRVYRRNHQWRFYAGGTRRILQTQDTLGEALSRLRLS